MPADEGKLGSGSSVSGSDISNIVQLFTGKSTSGTTWYSIYSEHWSSY
jgi:hypothetical protein